MDLELAGKTAVVAGGSRGIGKAVARVLGQEGVDVALVARTREPLEATAAELHAETGRRFIAVPADTTDDASMKHMAEEVAAAFGHIDILVNSAATRGSSAPNRGLPGVSDEWFWPDMNTKVMGYLRCAREIAPYMQRQKWGRIINISGLAARSSGNMIGSIRNVAVVSLTKCLADELGPDGINVTVVHPGLVRTEQWPQRVADTARQMGVSEAEAEDRMVNNALRRLIDANDIANVVAFLASPKAVSINGDVIAAAGGAGHSIYY